MEYFDLRDFIEKLRHKKELLDIPFSVSPNLEITGLCDKTLKNKGPALLFTNIIGYDVPVLGNLFGSTKRVALGMGASNTNDLRKIGSLLATLKEPKPPKDLMDVLGLGKLAKSLWDMKPSKQNSAPCQEIIIEGKDVDLSKFPIQQCWPDDASPLITWGLVITKGPNKKRQNLGIYRQQVIDSNKVIMRWLSHRGGALDFRDHSLQNPGKPFPISVALGADPATMLGAVTPVPDSLSEFQFAGLLRGSRTKVVKSIGSDLLVPATSEIILEGNIYPDNSKILREKSDFDSVNNYELALEGPFGDHTGYYNEKDWFPVFTIDRITMRKNPIYHSTYTGKPPDEPAILGTALNEVFIPILQKQFSEIIDFYLPSEGCSYRFAIVQIKKSYIGHPKRIMFGIWSFLRQFMYTKFIIVVDDDINIRNWSDVIWAISTRVDPSRDMTIIENTPIDYLDFASPISGLGSKMGIDATNKWPGETSREWGKIIKMNKEINSKIEHLWKKIDF